MVRFASSRTESGRMAFGSALGRLAQRRNCRRRPCKAGRDAGGRSTAVVPLLPPEKDLRVLLHSGVPTRARHTARKSHLSAIAVRRTWAGPFPSLRCRPNIRPPSLIPNRTAASSSFSPKRRPPNTKAAVTPAAGPPYGTTSSTSAGLRKSFGKLKVVEGLVSRSPQAKSAGFSEQTEAAKRPRSGCCAVY